MLAVSMPNFATSAALVDTATKCLATARSSRSVRSVHSRALRAFVIVSSVVKGLRRHDEQRLRRVEVARRLDEVGAVDVRDEAERHVAGAVVAKRLVGHYGAPVRPPGADVGDVAGPLPRVARSPRRSDPRRGSPP